MEHSLPEKQMPTVWFALGFLATICQVLLLRDFLVVCSGSELGIALLLTTWLSGIAIGAVISNLLRRTGIPAASLLPACLVALALSCPAGLLAMRLSGGLYPLPTGALAPLGLLLGIAMIAVIPAGLLVGLAFPLACAAACRDAESSSTPSAASKTSIVGRVYALEASGSVCAGLLHTWLLVNLMPALQTALLSSALLCAAAAVCVRPSRGVNGRGQRFSAARYAAALTAVLLLAAGLVPRLGGGLDRLSLERWWQGTHPGIELLQTEETPYQRLEAGLLGDQIVLSSNGTILTTIPDAYRATLLGHFFLSIHPDPRRVLVVGGLESGIAAPMLLHTGIEELRFVEQDQALPGLYSQHAADDDILALSDPRLAITIADGRRWINRTTESWDLIITLVPDPTTTMLNRYYTREFYQACGRRLAPGGILLCRITASGNYIEGEIGAIARSVFQTLGAEFEVVRASGGDQVVFAATNRNPGPGFFTPQQLVSNYESAVTNDPGFSPMAFHSLIEQERSLFLERKLARTTTGSSGEINTDWRPLAQARTLHLWSRFSGDALHRAYTLLFRPIPPWLAVLLLVPLPLWSLMPLLRRDRPPQGPGRITVVFGVLVAGFTGLALELICIHVYQGAFGNLYRMIGSMVALFMLGLSLGSAVAARKGRHHRVLVLALSGQSLTALAAPLLLYLAAEGKTIFALPGVPEGLVLLLAGAAGWFTGLALPAAAGILMRTAGSGVGRAAATINGADHLGAAAAAALIGLAAIPRLGVMVSSLLLTMLSLCCALRLVLEGSAGGFSSIHRRPDGRTRRMPPGSDASPGS